MGKSGAVRAMSKPNICQICGKIPSDFPPELAGNWIQFADYEPLPETDPPYIGGSDGDAYFCGEHFDAALALSHWPSIEAIANLRSVFVVAPPVCAQPEIPQGFFWRLIMLFR